MFVAKNENMRSDQLKCGELKVQIGFLGMTIGIQEDLSQALGCLPHRWEMVVLSMVLIKGTGRLRRQDHHSLLFHRSLHPKSIFPRMCSLFLETNATIFSIHVMHFDTGALNPEFKDPGFVSIA